MNEQAQANFRPMREGEAKELYQLAKKSFTFVEALGASVPRHAIVAEVEGKVAGALFLKIYKGRGGSKAGYLDLAFVSPEHRGQGIGGQLYPAATEWLREEGCGIIGAMVKDDNVASWGLLARQGFSMPGYFAFLRQYGLLSGLLMALRTLYLVACGMNFWTSEPGKRPGTLPELLCAFLFLLAFMGLRQGLKVLTGGTFLPMEIAAGVMVLAASVLGGFLGSRIAGGKWRFQMVRGGFAISFVLMLFGTYFPLLGRWYPEQYRNGREGRKALGFAGISEWAAIFLLYLVGQALLPFHLLWRLVAQYASILLVFHVLAIYPFEYIGGKRVLDWKLPLFIVASVLTVAAVALLQ